MDIRQIDEADCRVSLDLLCEWASATFRRTVPPVEGCSWRSLLAALEHAGAPGGPRELERSVRQHLVGCYAAQRKDVVAALISSKAACSRVFQQLCGASVSEAHVRWPWFLYCLTICTYEPLKEGAMRMPLDMVDLQVIAETMKASIMVSQLLRQAVLLQPTDGEALWSIHLLHHRGLWAPVLEPRAPEGEVAMLLGTVVELQRRDLPEEVERLSLSLGRTRLAGCVVAYDRARDLFLVDLGGHRVWLERSNIGATIYATQQAYPEEDADKQAASRSLLGGIPEGSLEWQVLHELVRREARGRLEHMLQHLAGRGEVAASASCAAAAQPRGFDRLPDVSAWLPAADEEPSPRGPRAGSGSSSSSSGRSRCKAANPQDASVPECVPWELGDPGPSWCFRLGFEDMRRELRAGGEMIVFAVRSFEPRKMWERYPSASAAKLLPLRVADEVRVAEVGKDWVYLIPVTSPNAVHGGWCPKDCLTVWEAHEPFRVPADGGEAAARFLALDVGDALVLSRRYEGAWEGWAAFTRWGTKRGEGVAPLVCLRPQVLVKRWTWEV